MFSKWIATLLTVLLRRSAVGFFVRDAKTRQRPTIANVPVVVVLKGNFDSNEDFDDDDEPPSVDIANFKPPTASFGWNKGRSSPSQRKALSKSGSSIAKTHICTTCGSETVKWMGRCPTCKEWNTLQEHAVVREPARSGSNRPRPFFSSSRPTTSQAASWLDGTDGGFSDGLTVGSTPPVRLTDLYESKEEGDATHTKTGRQRRRQRIWIPGDEELNTVLGGGIMQGSITLIGGDPGVGKSTLLLQIAGSIASLATPTPGIGMGAPDKKDDSSSDLGPVWYVSGEENPDQIASRAERLGIHETELFLLSETHADILCEQVVSQFYGASSSVDSEESGDDSVVLRKRAPSLIIVDSIQTIVCDAAGSSSAGGVSQVRESVALFLRLAKSTGIPVFLVGHVTKSGDVAGPRTVEHMVDCVLYLEGLLDQGALNLRMLRASKNRFGSSDEVGVYEMTAGRLLPVSDPSSLFLAHRSSLEDTEGRATAVVLEGMRPMTVEIQALVVPPGVEGGFGPTDGRWNCALPSVASNGGTSETWRDLHGQARCLRQRSGEHTA